MLCSKMVHIAIRSRPALWPRQHISLCSYLELAVVFALLFRSRHEQFLHVALAFLPEEILCCTLYKYDYEDAGALP